MSIVGNRSRTRRQGLLISRGVPALLVATLIAGLAPSSQAGLPPEVEAKSQEPTPEFAAGELLLRFHPNTAEQAKDAVRQRHDLEWIEDLSLDGVERVRLKDRGKVPDRARQVETEAVVRYAVPNYYRTLQATITNDPKFSELWGLDNTGQTGGSSDADIDAPEGWDGAASTQEVVVGVIDTGIQIDHPDLAGNIWTNPGEAGVDSLGRSLATNGIDDDVNGYIDDVHGWDFLQEDNTVYDRSDHDYHGTHVAGTIAAVRNNGVDITGVSDAKIMPLKVGFSVPFLCALDSDIVEAIVYSVRMGARLTNNSWGGGRSSPAIEEAIELADDAGRLFVAAAGNSYTDIDSYPTYPASYANANIVSVAATDHFDDRAWFSNYGAESVDLGAPGHRILSTFPQRHGKAILVGPDTDPTVNYRSALHTIGLEGVTDVGDRDALMAAALRWTGLSSNAPILVVDDDTGDSFETYYQSSIGTAGYSNLTTESVPYCDHGPSATKMASFGLVVWFTGDDFSCTLTETDQAELTTYLLGGGKLLLFGVDIGYDITDDGLLPNALFDGILRAKYAGDWDLDFAPIGASGSPYAGVPKLELNEGVFGAGQAYASAVEPRAGAIAALRGTGTNSALELSGTSMAAPHVSGVLAHIFAANPGIGHLDAKAVVMNSGDPLTALAGTTVSGKRINLAAALSKPAGGGGTFALSASPSKLTVVAGSTGTLTVTITSSDGFSGDVRLSVEGLPAGATGSFSPNPVTVPSGTTSTLTITTTNDVKAGRYPLTIMGTNRDQMQFESATLSIKGGGRK